MEERDQLWVGEHLVPPRCGIRVGGSTCIRPWIGTPAGCLGADVNVVVWAKQMLHEGEIMCVAIYVAAYEAGRVAL